MADYPIFKARVTAYNNTPYKVLQIGLNMLGSEGLSDNDGLAPTLEQISQALSDLFTPYGFDSFTVTQEVVTNPQVYPPV